MKIYILRIPVLLLYFLVGSLFAQEGTYRIYKKMNARKVYHLNSSAHGIKANSFGSGQNLDVEVRTVKSVSSTKCNGSGTQLLYKNYVSANTGSTLTHNGTPLDTRLPSGDIMGWSCGNGNSDQPKYFENRTLEVDQKLNGSTWWHWGKHYIEVEIILRVTGNYQLSNIQEVKVPGVVSLTGAEFNEASIAFVTVNSLGWRTLDEANLTTKLGDEIKFYVKTSKVPNIYESTFSKLPGVWVARFGWDVMYYMSESVSPNDYKPYLGFDSQVHSVYFRRFEDYFEPSTSHSSGYAIQEDNWKIEGDYWTWSYTVPARMDRDKADYTPTVNWEVTKVAGQTDPSSGGTYNKTQRHDQRRGINMNLLSRWSNSFDGSGITGNFQNYTGNKYFLGLDPDEFVYTNRNETPVTAFDGKPKVLKVEGYSWHELLPEESALVSSGKNNKADGLALSYMVTAYQRNKSRNANYPIYEGHEIEDEGVFIKNNGSPCGGQTDCFYKVNNSQTPNSAPGKDLFYTTNTSSDNATGIKYKIQASSPQSTDYGFYGSIVGTDWPSVWEEDVPYTLKGLNNLSTTEIQKYSLELQYEDELGYLTKIEKKPSTSEASTSRNTGKWTASFDLEGFGNYNVTAYYKRCNTCKKVPIAGKELNVIEMRFLGVNEQGWQSDNIKKYDGARGDGYFWYVQDELRRYTITKNQNMNFSIMDSDPHTFRPDGTEFYISNRAKAKRIPTDSLFGINGYMKWYVASVNENTGAEGARTYIGAGTNISYAFNNNGLYAIKAIYRDKSEVKHLIKVVDHAYSSAADNSQKGSIITRDLTGNETIWLTNAGYNTTNKKIASLIDILSRYTYTEAGVRGSSTYDTENDFVAEFEWKNSFNQVLSLTPITFDQNSIFPTEWIRHTKGDAATGKQIATSQIITVNEGNNWNFSDGTIEVKLQSLFSTAPEAWDLRLPWVSTTATHGYQVRNNIKSIIDLPQLYNNTNGGFTGKGNVKYANKNDYKNAVNDPFNFSDYNIKWQRFYEDLRTGRKILVSPGETTSLSVRNKGTNKDNTAFNNFIASGIVSNSRVDNVVEGAVETELLSELNIYPNPTENGRFMVEFGLENAGDVTLEITNLNGQVIHTQELESMSSGVHQLLVGEKLKLATGIYILHVKSTEFDKSLRLIMQ